MLSLTEQIYNATVQIYNEECCKTNIGPKDNGYHSPTAEEFPPQVS